MKLYFSKGACSLVPRIIINELNIPCDYIAVDLKTKKMENGEDYLTVNPKGSVPVIETNDGEVLTENAVILQYLADTNKAHELLPALGDFKRYRVLEWLNYMATEMHKGVGILFSPAIPQEIKEQVFIPLIKAKLTFLDKHLSQNKFLNGDSFTLPDAYLFVVLNWTLHFKFNLQEWKNVARFYGEVKERTAVQKSLEQEGLLKVAS